MKKLRLVPALSAALLLSACGGGWLFEDDEPASGTDTTAAASTSTTGTETPAATTATTSTTTTASTPSCNTAGYVAGSVEAPTTAQWAAYAGTFDGDEGQYSTGSGVFIKSGSATMVLGADGALSYKGTSYAVSSACIDKVSGPYGKILYLVAGKGHLDVADKADATLGHAWGIALTDGSTIFTKAAKR